VLSTHLERLSQTAIKEWEMNKRSESLLSIRTKTRWLRKEEGEHRLVLSLHPDDLELARRLFERSGQAAAVTWCVVREQ
jgi:hypothetical protein